MLQDKKIVERFWNKVDKLDDTKLCWEWKASKDRYGYGRFKIGNKTIGSHIITYKLYNNISNLQDLHILHTCDNRSCVNPNHLFTGTNLDNIADRQSKGREAHNKGVVHGRAKLMDEEIFYIREQVKSGKLHRELAKELNVSRVTITRIVNRVIWTHI
jgi:hypothetical protein